MPKSVTTILTTIDCTGAPACPSGSEGAGCAICKPGYAAKPYNEGWTWHGHADPHATCKKCQAGSYSPGGHKDDEVCTACPRGLTTATDGATSADACTR